MSVLAWILCIFGGLVFIGIIIAAIVVIAIVFGAKLSNLAIEEMVGRWSGWR